MSMAGYRTSYKFILVVYATSFLVCVFVSYIRHNKVFVNKLEFRNTLERRDSRKLLELRDPRDFLKQNDDNERKSLRRAINSNVKHTRTLVHMNDIVDALWTKQPKTKNNHSITVRTFNTSGNDSLKRAHVMHVSATTPSVTDAPTTPLTTQSDTTPIYTEAPTSPITTESVTTPIVTQPGGDVEVSTESDDPNDTLRLVRRRRDGGTPTTPDPFTTSVSPIINCNDTNESYFNKEKNRCECNLGYKGLTCTNEKNVDDQQQDLESSLEISTAIDGEYNDNVRDKLQNELEKQYKNLHGLMRIFVLPFSYNATNDRTKLKYIVVFNSSADPWEISSLASITNEVIKNNFNLTINGKRVIFSNDLTNMTVKSTDKTIPIDATIDTNVCYVFNNLNACLNGGRCFNKNGAPSCQCTPDYLGIICADKVKTDSSTSKKVLVVLFPILSGMVALTFLCCCCWFIARCLNKGSDDTRESVTTESSWTDIPKSALMLPRYHLSGLAWKQYLGGTEEFEQDSKPSYQMLIAESVKGSSRVGSINSSYIEDVRPVPVERNIAYIEEIHVRPVKIEQIVEEEVIVRRPVIVEHTTDDFSDRVHILEDSAIHDDLDMAYTTHTVQHMPSGFSRDNIPTMRITDERALKDPTVGSSIHEDEHFRWRDDANHFDDKFYIRRPTVSEDASQAYF